MSKFLRGSRNLRIPPIPPLSSSPRFYKWSRATPAAEIPRGVTRSLKPKPIRYRSHFRKYHSTPNTAHTTATAMSKGIMGPNTSPPGASVHKPDDAEHPESLRKASVNLSLQIQYFLTRTYPPTSLLSRVQTQTRSSLRVIDDALSRYAPNELSISFNGGKDCLALLVLLVARLGVVADSINSVYVMSEHPFSQVDQFVDECVARYGLRLQRYALPMKCAFERYLAENPDTRAIFVGTRRTDPHGAELSSFDRTDHGWPEFMRVHPVVDWRYAEIWGFLRALEIPYCVLYDQGYTSLGGTTDTHPNPKLLIEGKGEFRPAYELVEDEEERLGRDR